jgi:hypothetical protein
MLERLARRWAVSKSEALRRAIRAAAEHGMSGEREARLSAGGNSRLASGSPGGSQGVGTTNAGGAVRLARSTLVIHLGDGF